MNLKKWLPVLIIATLIIVFSLVPPIGVGEGTEGVNEGYIAHFGMYGLLGLFLFRALKSKKLILPLAIATIFGIAIETIQFFLPYRTGTILDALVNSIGAFAGIMFIKYYAKSKSFLLNIRLTKKGSAKKHGVE